ncbi:hypothetical protein ACFWMU_35635 [Streptomyces sp. NPDC058357]|uniref:hypothetical protein n=1 Tax=unclassified Streptomyces TaxID=2593676 RepID=UPI003666208F
MAEQFGSDYARSLRELYRRRPRALLISLDEDAPPASVHPNRLLHLVPDTCLEDHADLDIPTLRRAAALPLPTADEQFDQVVSAVTTRIRRELADAGVPGSRDGAEG